MLYKNCILLLMFIDFTTALQLRPSFHKAYSHFISSIFKVFGYSFFLRQPITKKRIKKRFPVADS